MEVTQVKANSFLCTAGKNKLTLTLCNAFDLHIVIQLPLLPSSLLLLHFLLQFFADCLFLG